MIRTTLPLLVACLLAGTADAEIYRHVGPDGSVHFTDSPPDHGTAERVELPPVNTIRPETRSAAGAPLPAEQTAKTYRNLQLESVPGTTVSNPTAPLVVTARPDIALQAGHVIVFEVNGQRTASTNQGQSVAINEPARGQYVFTAEIRDEQGRTLIRSAPLTVQVHRTTIPPARVTPR